MEQSGSIGNKSKDGKERRVKMEKLENRRSNRI